jgi:hypothetical protein
MFTLIFVLQLSNWHTEGKPEFCGFIYSQLGLWNLHELFDWMSESKEKLFEMALKMLQFLLECCKEQGVGIVKLSL